jgi:hypothetical protein
LRIDTLRAKAVEDADRVHYGARGTTVDAVNKGDVVATIGAEDGLVAGDERAALRDRVLGPSRLAGNVAAMNRSIGS